MKTWCHFRVWAVIYCNLHSGSIKCVCSAVLVQSQPVTRLETIRGSTSICSILIRSSPGKAKYLISLRDRLWGRKAKPRITPGFIYTFAHTRTHKSTNVHKVRQSQPCAEKTVLNLHQAALTQSHGGDGEQNEQVPLEETFDAVPADGAYPLLHAAGSPLHCPA